MQELLAEGMARAKVWRCDPWRNGEAGLCCVGEGKQRGAGPETETNQAHGGRQSVVEAVEEGNYIQDRDCEPGRLELSKHYHSLSNAHMPGTLLFMVSPRDRLSAPFSQGRSSYEHVGVSHLGPRGHYFISYHIVLYILSFCFCLSALQRRSRQSKNNIKPQHLSKLETPITRGKGEGPEAGALGVPLGGEWPQLISGDALFTMAML